jgi:secondary thiamine-phosphate synthase enzyme
LKCVNHVVEIETHAEREFHDLTPQLRGVISESGIRQGWVIVSSLHTTCAVILNENEPRLLGDIKGVLDRLAPKDAYYLHNDIFARNLPDEPLNAHSHIAAILLGASKALSLVDGALVLGTWQSVLFVELDGPRRRKVNVQIIGTA